jgi:CDP-paratose 2-epimerase
MEEQMERMVLITGGAGFIGSNLAERLLKDRKTHVRIFDNFSRRGVERNVDWLRSMASANRLEIVRGDVRDARAVRQAASGVTEIYHFAAQVAVTSSLEDPITDFEVNAHGTLNVLEAARVNRKRPFMLFTSTNKVYGSLQSVALSVEGTHYCASARNFKGVREDTHLDSHSPYGCSKGAADQYVRDYARIYDLPTVVFRMSCIAGPRQFGNEDQGWVAHFIYSMLSGRPITIYGDGYQVRDVLHVHDLIDAMGLARRNYLRTRGQVYNLGGGFDRSVSVIELLRQIELRTRRRLNLDYSAARPGDQPWYVADTTKLETDTGWRARRSLEQILESIHGFWKETHSDAAIHQDAKIFAQEVA